MLQSRPRRRPKAPGKGTPPRDAGRGAGRAREEWVKAVRDGDKKLARFPENGLQFVARGQAYLDLGEARRAIKDFDAALVLREGGAWNLGMAYLDRGLAHLALGDADES